MAVHDSRPSPPITRQKNMVEAPMGEFLGPVSLQSTEKWSLKRYASGPNELTYLYTRISDVEDNGTDESDSSSTGTVQVHLSQSSVNKHEVIPNSDHTTADINDTQTRADVLREEIRTSQAIDEKNFDKEVKELLKNYLPHFALEPDSRIKEEHRTDKTPTVIDLEVRRAQANAKLNVYLSYCKKLSKKQKFLGEYIKLDTKYHKAADTQTKQIELADMYHKKDENGEPVLHVVDQTKKDKYPERTHKEGPKKEIGEVGVLKPMLPKKYVGPGRVTPLEE